MATKVTESYFELGGRKYFRGNAQLLQMGTFGAKNGSFGGRAYLDPEANVLPAYLEGRVLAGTIAKIDWAQVSKTAVEVNGQLTYQGLDGAVEVGAGYEKIKTARLELANFYMLEAPLKEMLNTVADGARKGLAKEGADGRIVTEVWVGLTIELAEHFRSYAAGTLSVKAKDGALQATATGGKHGAQSIQFLPGTCFAYKLHKVKDWKNGKTFIANMEADYPGMS